MENNNNEVEKKAPYPGLAAGLAVFSVVAAISIVAFYLYTVIAGM